MQAQEESILRAEQLQSLWNRKKCDLLKEKQGQCVKLVHQWGKWLSSMAEDGKARGGRQGPLSPEPVVGNK